MYLPHQFTEDSFGPVTSDCISKSLPHDNSNTTWGIIHLVRQKIEEGGRHSATLLFDDLNVTSAAQKNDISSLRFIGKGISLRRIPSAHDPGEDSSW